MLSDFNEIASPDKEIRADFCIIGSGPAGLTLAVSLAGARKSVILAEGGSYDFSEESQDIYRGENHGLDYYDLESARLRYFGGTSNHWSGMCGIFDAVDFEQRDIFGMPGWPIEREEILKYLPIARGILDLDNTNLLQVEDPAWNGRLWRQRPVAYSPPTRFGEKYRTEAAQNPLLNILLNANLTNIELENDLGATASLTVTNYHGVTAKLTAGTYVLAMGALENARMLLNCSGQVKQGIGNGHDMVGRCFMEHLNVQLARFISTNNDFWFPDGNPRGQQLLPMPSLMKSEKIGNGVVAFGPFSKPVSYGRTRYFKQIIRNLVCSTNWSRDGGRYLVDFNCAGEGIVTSLIEQLPNPESRIELIEQLDRFGLRRVGLNWAITDGDRRTIRRLAIGVAKEMAELDIARLQLMPYITDESLEIPIHGHAHQMGTTRMSLSPANGVVDRDCRVHGIRNLYIAGSSVFPTGGGTNPTLTIVMLTLRLAELLMKAG
jgi:choline dehydrogenase-like flavoprotein